MPFSCSANQKDYPFKLIELPYSKESMQPYMSVETFDYHYGKHHANYVNTLNKLLEKRTDLQQKSLKDIILSSAQDMSNKAIFNNAAQMWNHNFFWYSLRGEKQSSKPTSKLLDQINKDFGSYESFTQQFQEMALKQFGSGWAWLIYDNDKKLKIITTSNAESPLVSNQIPILTCDVWEHAYYIDYRNNRAKYLQQFIDFLANWQFAESNFLYALNLLENKSK